MASDWSNFGLPPVQEDGYGYTVASGVLRTPFDTAQPRQKRGNVLNVRQFAGHVLLTQAQLGNAEAAINAFGFQWFTLELISGYANSALVPGEYPSIHSVRLTADYRVSAVGVDTYRLELALESRELPYQWLIADGLTWTTSAVARYVGLRVSPVPFPTTVKGVRFRAGQAGSTISSAYLVNDGVRTDIITTPTPCGTEWLVVNLPPFQVAELGTLDIAMTCSSYAWVSNLFASNNTLRGFEAGADNYPPAVFTSSAFGVDVLYRYNNKAVS